MAHHPCSRVPSVPGLVDALNHFLDTLANVNTVIIMGNSCDKVDMPYYRDVLAPRYRDAKWVFCEHESNEDKEYDIDVFVVTSLSQTIASPVTRSLIRGMISRELNSRVPRPHPA